MAGKSLLELTLFRSLSLLAFRHERFLACRKVWGSERRGPTRGPTNLSPIRLKSYWGRRNSRLDGLATGYRLLNLSMKQSTLATGNLRTGVTRLIWSPSCAPSSSAWIFLSFSIKIFLLFNTGLRFSSGFLSYSFVQIIFAVLFRAPNHQFVDKKKYAEFSFGAFTSEIRFRTDVGCLNQHRGQRSAHVRTL